MTLPLLEAVRCVTPPFAFPPRRGSTMFTIGEFSRITSLSIKTLRYYHERGLLVPARVEAGTGYRHYSPGDVERARAIKVLRSLDFSLDEVGALLADYDEDQGLIRHLERRRAAVRSEVARQREIAATLDRLIKAESDARQPMGHAGDEIVEKTVPSLLVAGIRMRGRYDECGAGFGKLGRAMGRHIAGKAMCLYYDNEYREEDADFEPCLPVRKALEKPGVSVRELPEIRCLALVKRGPYEDLGSAYEQLLTHAKQHGLRLATPSREVYLKGPGMIFRGNPDNYLTEIQMPIAGRAE